MIESLWPLSNQVRRIDRFLHRMGRYPGFCNLCGRLTFFDTTEENFREHVPCGHCSGVNRYRQIAAVLLRQALGNDAKRFSSLNDLPSELIIWNTETTRALHGCLSACSLKGYIASEFFDPELRSGDEVNGILHVDMQKTHFPDESIDYILSSDVVEHIPQYIEAIAETYRVLRYGGAHIFSVPFYHHRFTVERRSILQPSGDLKHFRTPWYHGDPLRGDGVLCFNVFAPELLVEIEHIGFEAHLFHINDPLLGILGNNGLVIMAHKVREPSMKKDYIFP